jgi:hypothetical protein
MTTIDAESRPKQFARLTVLASCTGTALEWYDFYIYGTAAALVFGTQFFLSTDPVVGTLLAFVAFGVGFLARPLHPGDSS